MNKSDEAKTTDELPFKGLSVLVAEDHPQVLHVFTIFLQGLGFSVDTAENGQVALGKYLANNKKYNVIIMDYNMPVMNGYMAAEKIRNSGYGDSATLPVICISSNHVNESFVFTRCLRKPIDMQSLISILHELLKG